MARLYGELGSSYSILGDHEESVKYFSHALAIDIPQNKHILLEFGFAKALHKSGKQSDALERIGKVSPQNGAQFLMKCLLEKEFSSK